LQFKISTHTCCYSHSCIVTIAGGGGDAAVASASGGGAIAAALAGCACGTSLAANPTQLGLFPVATWASFCMLGIKQQWERVGWVHMIMHS